MAYLLLESCGSCAITNVDRALNDQATSVQPSSLGQNQLPEMQERERTSLESRLEALGQRARGLQQHCEWVARRASFLADQQAQVEAEMRTLQEELQRFAAAKDCEQEPGQTPEYQTCQLLGLIVLVLNVLTNVMEMWDPQCVDTFFWLDQAYLVYYIAELIVKVYTYRCDFLVGKDWALHWLDLVNVAVGVTDQWVKPWLWARFCAPHVSQSSLITSAMVTGFSHVRVATGAGHTAATNVMCATFSGFVHVPRYLRILRMLRLLRLAKLVATFQSLDLSWTEKDPFHLFIMGAIVFNSIVMGLEVEFPNIVLWDVLNNLVLIVFVFELYARLRRLGCSVFFIHGAQTLLWNWFDFIVVLAGAVDEWLVPGCIILHRILDEDDSDEFAHLAKDDPVRNVGHIITAVRVVRLLRILRLIQLIRRVPPLLNLVVGIMKAMQGMVWVLVLTFVLLYAFALLGVTLLGRGLLFGGQAPESVAAVFPGIAEATFVLFMVMNGDVSLLEPVFEALPGSKVIVVLFMVISSWAILSILTAVVSENMINATDENKKALEEEEAAQRAEESKWLLSSILEEADKNGNGHLERHEFEALLDTTNLEHLTAVSGLTKEDLLEDFENLLWTHHEDAAHVPRPALEKWYHRPRRSSTSAHERALLRLERRLAILERSVRGRVSRIE